MNKKLENFEKCPSCGGPMYYQAVDNIIKGGYNKKCHLCMSAIDNVDIIENKLALTNPNFIQGYGGLCLGTDNEITLIHLKKDYSNLEALIDAGNNYVQKNEKNAKHCYLYKFNPENKTGEFIWGKYYNPFK